MKITEREHEEGVVAWARLQGWRHYHTRDSRRSVAGFPDLVLVRPPRLLVIELKAETGRLSVDQQEWLELFTAVPGVEVYVWRPSDWQEIERKLRR